MKKNTNTGSDNKVRQGLLESMILRSGDQVLETRGKRLIESLRESQQKLVFDKRDKVRKLEEKLDFMTDMSPDNRYALKLGEVDATKWTAEYQAASVELVNAQVELKVAEDNMEKLF